MNNYTNVNNLQMSANNQVRIDTVKSIRELNTKISNTQISPSSSYTMDKNRENDKNIQELDKLFDDINTKLFNKETKVQYDIDDKTSEIVVKFVNNTSGDIIKQFPKELTLENLAKSLEEDTLLFDQKQ